MNNKESALKSIIDFLGSEEKYLILNGTNQYEKHPLVLAAVVYAAPANSTILFRVNHKTHIKDFLSSVINLSKNPQPGKPIKVDGKYLYVDTINPSSWGKTPRKIDYAIIYPIDSLNSKTGDDNLTDVKNRNPQKIFLVTWTDNKDMSWTNSYNPTIVTYDAVEEDPDYHHRVASLNKDVREEKITGLPDYANDVSSSLLVNILCRNCSKSRWAKLNKPFPGFDKLKSAEFGEYTATCLVCGYTAHDNYNWGRK